MEITRNRVLIAAEDYQFLDTVHTSRAAPVQEWQIASTLERLIPLTTPAPFAIVVDLEAASFDALDVLEMFGSMRLQSHIVLLNGTDLRKLADARRVAAAVGLEIAGTLERPLMMSALSQLLERHAVACAPIDADELRRALAGDELLLHYQPILSRAGNDWNITGTEALVRWQHPERGLLYPGQFLKVAEGAGLLGELTDFVIASAVRQAGAWVQRNLDLTVAVNLSPSLVRDFGFVDRFMRVLHEYEVMPDRITLEVIEAASLQDRALLREVLGRLRLHGVTLSLDDFGTGHSSLTDLCRLPFNEIKIDRTLINAVPEQREASTVTCAIVDLAHRLSMRVCAEGVETDEAFRFLAAAGCDSMQGIAFAAPVQAGEIESLARRRRAA
jgi:EAL domain-containing protein (putative c-di-GMP-specific phosphodiesterase class I)